MHRCIHRFATVMRAPRLGVMTLAGSIALTACLSPIGSEGHEEPDVTGFVITHGANVVELGPGGQEGTLTLVAGQPNAVTVRVLGTDGGDEPQVHEHPDEFEVEMLTPSGISRFVATGDGYPYAGEITPGTVLGQAVYFVELHGIEHGHGAEFRAPLVVTVVAP